MHAQLEAPPPISHAGLLLEQAAQRPLGCACAHAELAEHDGGGEVVLDDACRPAQAWIMGFGAIPVVLALLVWLPWAMRAVTASPTTSGASVDAIVEARGEPRMSALLRDPVAWAVAGFLGRRGSAT